MKIFGIDDKDTQGEFSENGDGKVDSYFINQWGDLAFESVDYKDSWDGYDFKGFKMPLDTYVWKIYIEDYLGKINVLTGKVLLSK